jgi:DNA-directed RNA polymerase specialized sigma54-like protein
VLRLPVSLDWMQNLRGRLLSESSEAQAIMAQGSRQSKPVVTYLERQSTTRRLTDASHEALQAALQKLDDQGLIEYRPETFGSVTGVSVSFEVQVAKVATSDVSVWRCRYGLS